MIIAIDPGLRETGLVLYGDHGVMETRTIRCNKPAYTQQEMAEAVNSIIYDLRFITWVTDEIVIEGFVYMHNRFKASSLSTVFLVGALMREYPDAVWQTSAEVLNPSRAGNFAYIKDHPELVPGGEVCKNDHERSALAHMAYYLHKTRGMKFEEATNG